MKTSNQILLVIVALIILGVLYKFSGKYLDERKKEAAALAEREVSTAAAAKDPTIDSSVEIVKPYIAIEPEKVWPEILVGKWNFFEQEYTEHESWQIRGTLEFKKNKKFILKVQLFFYDYDNEVKYQESRKASIEGSGFVNGGWKIVKGKIMLTSDTCNINRTYSAPPEGSYSKHDYSDYEMRGCEYFEEMNIGTVSDNETELEIEKFNKDTIMTSGNHFGRGAAINYSITKQHSR